MKVIVRVRLKLPFFPGKTMQRYGTQGGHRVRSGVEEGRACQGGQGAESLKQQARIKDQFKPGLYSFANWISRELTQWRRLQIYFYDLSFLWHKNVPISASFSFTRIKTVDSRRNWTQAVRIEGEHPDHLPFCLGNRWDGCIFKQERSIGS